MPDESPAQRELYRPDLLLIPRLTNEMLSLLRSATTPSAVSALARSAVLQASRKRGRPSGLRGAAYPAAAAASASLPRGRKLGFPVAVDGRAAAPLPCGLSFAAASSATAAATFAPMGSLLPGHKRGRPVAVAGDVAVPLPRRPSSAAPVPAASASSLLPHGPTAAAAAMDVDAMFALPAVAPLSSLFRVPAALREHCTVYLGEYSHCNDNNSSERYSEKLLQHSRLRVALERNGWVVVVVPLLVGTAGTVFQPILTFLTDSMDVPPSEARACLSRLHVHAVTSCHSIICDRRQLERVPNPNHSSPP